MGKKIHVHFMGIGGSGMAPAALLAKQYGFEVSGCDASGTSYYGDALENNNIPISIGHSKDHLKDVDILAVTPAVFDINPDHPEIKEAKKRKILMTWQEFMGKYLQKNKYVIAVSGTHGKSTTTVLAGLALEAAGFDPIVEAGTIYKPWGGGFRIADSKYFVCEADEFNQNFLNYSPEIIIINNIEMDHPEFYKDFDEFKNAFVKFIGNMKKHGILIVNEESQAIKEVLHKAKKYIDKNHIKVIGYYINNKFSYPFKKEYKAEITETNENYYSFNLKGKYVDEEFKLGIVGVHNVLNSLGVLCASIELGADLNILKKVFEGYHGIGRRTELVKEVKNIKVYDDYGHHPTAIAAVLETFKTIYPDRKIIAVVEPHQISRLKLFPEEFVRALGIADRSIVTKTFIGREANKELEPIDINTLVTKVKGGTSEYIEEFSEVAEVLSEEAHENDIIIVFGAGNSYKLSRMIIEKIESL